jgi:hypothetical protein
MKWIAIAAAVFGFYYFVTYSPVRSVERVDLSAEELMIVKMVVVKDFIAPEASMFRNVRAELVTLTLGKTYRRVCGEVNAFNRYGAYDGFVEFGGKMDGYLFHPDYYFEPCRY